MPPRYRPQPRPAKASIDIVSALTDRNLLGAALRNPDSWARWLSVLKAAFALPLSATDKEAFGEVAGGRQPPQERVSELWCTVGRRSGKSRIAAALAVYAAAFIPRRLARGEVGTVLVLAASQAQAATVFGYCTGFLEASPVLKREIASATRTEIRLRNGNAIAVHANSYRSIRGRTLLACIFDEIAFWRDETSAVPDLEVYRAVVPALATTGGMLVGISSPYRKTGLLHQKWRDHYAKNGDRVLVVGGASRLFNPTLDADIIAAAMADDPESARAEWQAEFRTDIAAFLDDATIERCIDFGRPLEIPPRPGISYSAFVDPSGGRHDCFTLAIGHREGTGSGAFYVVDAIRGVHPPFDPAAVVGEFAALLKDYRIAIVIGDNYSAAWVETAFSKAGIRYSRSEQAKSQLYLESLPLFMRQAISIPAHDRLLRELRLLERRTSRSGRDSVDHSPHGSDDYANSLAGLLRGLAKRPDVNLSWVSGEDDENEDGKQSHAAQMLTAYLAAHGVFC
jgi:hypothetical protein